MKERIKELAIQSGLIAPYGSDHEGLRDFDYRKFAELVRADEREACAKLAEEMERIRFDSVGDPRIRVFESQIAKAIRSRGEK